jgi:wyosine [tRNA(Phe)-imidazoG37] synthetase (radical SAM superfamily)
VLLPLKPGILYGPVKSRRYGLSLGVNLMPVRYKVCTFNCVYCHFGWTARLQSDAAGCERDLPTVADVVSAVESAARSTADFGLITFSGNGEPTVHPGFSQLVEEISQLRDRWRPEARLALLSNSCGLGNEAVRGSLARVDLPIFKLDAGTEETFQALNRPATGIRLSKLVDRLASLESIILQTALVDGELSNTGERELAAYAELVAHIRPREVHLYSIDRAVPMKGLVLVPPARLSEIARRLEQGSGVRFRAFSAAGAEDSAAGPSA